MCRTWSIAAVQSLDEIWKCWLLLIKCSMNFLLGIWRGFKRSLRPTNRAQKSTDVKKCLNGQSPSLGTLDCFLERSLTAAGTAIRHPHQVRVQAAASRRSSKASTVPCMPVSKLYRAFDICLPSDMQLHETEDCPVGGIFGDFYKWQEEKMQGSGRYLAGEGNFIVLLLA